MPVVAVLAIAVVVLILGGLIVAGIRSSGKGDSLEDRLSELGALDRPPSLEEIELSMPFAERVVLPALQRVADYVTRMAPAQTIERTRHKLELAGNPYRIGAAEFLAIRYILGAVLGGAMILGVGPSAIGVLQKLLIIPAVGALGMYLPIMWLGSLITKRQEEVIKSLPDVLDLLTICVEAGLGFDLAMQKVADKWDNELCRAFGRVLREVQLGMVRREALRTMADNLEVSDLSTFVAAVIQAETLGVSMSKILRIQSDQMRVRRRQRAEEKARQAPLKIMIPTAILIFPALFIVLLGPAVLTIKNSGMSQALGM